MFEDELISIIDDDTLARHGVAALVESLGYKAVSFSSAEHFLASDAIAETTCLITDLQMPGLSGLELQEALRSQGHRTPVILMTAYPTSCIEAASTSSMILLLVAIETHKVLPAKLMQVAEDAAANWTKGTVETLLPAPATIATASTAGPKVQPKVATTTTPPALTANQKSSSVVEVVLKQDGGIFVVPVEINGTMTLDFAVDSGASDVSIPADVFSTLLRTGTVKGSDIIGEQTVELADGSQSKLPVVTIRSLKVGNKVIENVKAIVAPVKGTLLLGQSFLGRFKSWSLDNAKHVLLLNQQ